MVTRRRFLQGVGAAGLALGLERCTARAGAVSAASGSGILVVVDLDGGNDWLNALPPLSGANRNAYDAARPGLGVPALSLVDLGGGVGLHPDFTGMADLWTAGRVAFIPGIGMDNPNLSHFVSADMWGQGAAVPDGSGWLGRFADRAFAPADVLRGISVTSDLPVMLRGRERSFVSISSASGFVYPASLRGNRLGAPWEPQLLEDGFAQAVSSRAVDVAALLGPDGQGGYDAGAAAGKLFLDAQNGFGTDGTLPARTPRVPYPGDAAYPVRRLDGGNLSGSLSAQLKLVARMLASGVVAQVYFTRIGGWDTHANQAVDHPNLLRTLGGTLGAFYQDLATIPATDGTMQDKVMVLAWSEFGRRVKENQGGTDHGTAGLSLCLGNAVHGGFAGFGYPDLGRLDGNGNMLHTTDFRSLYATLLERWLGLGPAETDAVLGRAYPRLGFL